MCIPPLLHTAADTTILHLFFWFLLYSRYTFLFCYAAHHGDAVAALRLVPHAATPRHHPPLPHGDYPLPHTAPIRCFSLPHPTYCLHYKCSTFVPVRTRR